MAELTESGEFIGGQALADPSNTRTIRLLGGVPAVTDGPFAEAKEHFAGYSSSTARAPSGRPRSRGAGRTRGHAAWRSAPIMDGAGRRCDAPAAIEDLLRALAPQVLGVLVRRYGQFDACEDAVQEALLAAASSGRRRAAGQSAGLADHGRDPAADRRVAQRTRAGAARNAAAARAARGHVRRRRTTSSRSTDDTLTLLFLCCHPALSPASQLALTLRAVGGLTTAEIAARVPGARGDDGAADQPGEAAHQGGRRPFELPPDARARRAAAGRAARPVPDLQRGLHRQSGPELQRPTSTARGDPADPRGCTRCARRRRGRRAAGVDAADRRPRERAHRRRRRLVPLAEQDRTRWDRARSTRASR